MRTLSSSPSSFLYLQKQNINWKKKLWHIIPSYCPRETQGRWADGPLPTSTNGLISFLHLNFKSENLVPSPTFCFLWPLSSLVSFFQKQSTFLEIFPIVCIKKINCRIKSTQFLSGVELMDFPLGLGLHYTLFIFNRSIL